MELITNISVILIVLLGIRLILVLKKHKKSYKLIVTLTILVSVIRLLYYLCRLAAVPSILLTLTDLASLFVTWFAGFTLAMSLITLTVWPPDKRKDLYE